MRTIHARIGWIALAALAAAGGCRGGREESQVGSAQAPLALVFSPSHAARTKPGELDELAKLVSKHSGLAVTARAATSAVDAIQSFGARRADAGLLTLFEYMLAHQEYGAQAALRVLRDGGKATYQGQIVVKADSPARTIQDLQGAVMAYTEPYSMSGFVLPAMLLRGGNVTIRPLFATSHEAALSQLRSGGAAAAATWSGAVADDPSLRVLATTEEVPNEPVIFRKDLEPAKRQKLVDALMAVAASDEGKRILHDVASVGGFVTVADADYRPVPEMVRRAGHSLEDLVPGGWIIWTSNRADYWP